jgi:2-polyprenyl-3-methyl-5-hydroxy-6-metoxy-1,4-benzoquinol methylase
MKNTLGPLARLAAAAQGGDISAFLDVWLREDLLLEKDASVLRTYYRSYARHFGAYAKHHYRNQTRELMVDPRDRPGARMLEIGCGCGTESLWFAVRGFKVTAADVSEDFLKVAGARKALLERALGRTLACEFRHVSVLDLDEEPFDLVWMEQAFHHLEPRDAVVRKISGLLRPGGRLFISECNAWNPLQQLVLLRLRGTNTIITHQGVPWGHERILTPWRLRSHFAPFGIEQVGLRYFRTLPNREWADWLTSRVGMFDDADHWWMRSFYTHYNYLGIKRG